MITINEMLKGKIFEDLTIEQQNNLNKLLVIVNKIRILWEKPMIVTNCIRTIDEHIQIYKDKAAKAGKPFDISKVPMKSKHLCGAAVDIADTGLILTKWLEDNPQVMEECGIFCELTNTNWVHIQFLPFGSYKDGGSRWFNP